MPPPASPGGGGGSGNGGAINVIGELVQHVEAGQEASCELSAVGFSRESIDINVLSPSKVPVSYRLKEDDGLFNISFKPMEVGTFAMDIYVSGHKIPESPLFFKVYDSSLIRVSEIRNGIVGQPSQFRVDASQAGEGQLEIAINDGAVPNHVQVLGGGRCLVHFTPEYPKSHTIDIKFNGEPVPGCPFVCQIADTSKVSVALHHLELMAVNKKASFQIHVETSDNAELAVSVTGPRKDIPVQVTGNVKDGFVAQFVPDEVGPYIIGVEYNNVPVGGTPFTGKAYDSNNVIVSAIPWGTIGKSLEFTVDASRAGEGNLEITIAARGRNIPTQVHPQGSARFAVSFVPLEATDHVINITFNKDVVPGAPFVAKIHTDPNRILVSGQSLAATAVGKQSCFTLSNVVGAMEDIEIMIDAPSGDAVLADITDTGNGAFRVDFTPQIAGEHQIYLTFASEPIPGSPFACKVYNVDAIQVRECPKGIVGKPVTFLVETSRAGPGNLEVTVNNGQVPTSAQAQGNHTYAISFIPKEAKPHIVELKFNGENVPGSPFHCSVVDAAKVNLSGEGLDKVPVGKQATFFIEGQFDMGDPEVKILSPMKRILPSSIRFIGEGHFAVDYTPISVGDHQVEVKMGDVQVQGSPFVIKAFDVSKVNVTNVANGFVGKPVYFSIDASQAGAGNLEIIVSVNGKNVPNYVQSEGNAKFRVNFKPLEAQTHMLSVKFNNESVPNSPFACEIQGSKVVSLNGPGMQLCPVQKETHFTIDSTTSEQKEHNYDLLIISPSGEEVTSRLIRKSAPTPSPVPQQLQQQQQIQYLVTYTPTEVGPHIIKLNEDNVPVDGSPFTCNVYDVSKIQVAGLTKSCSRGEAVTFTVDASKAGEGTLELVVTTAKTSVRAEVQARSRGLYDVTFVPQESLPHFINITFNEEHINSSPFECEVLTVGSAIGTAGMDTDGTIRFEAAMATQNGALINSNATDVMKGIRGEGTMSAVRGKYASFEVDSELFPHNMSLRILDINGTSVPYEKSHIGSEVYRIRYMPKMVGSHAIETIVDGKGGDGFPVKQTRLINVYDPSKIQVHLSGVPVVGDNNNFVIDTAGAGKGALSVSIKSANGEEVRHSIRDIGHGRFEVTYYPTVPIAHRLDIKYNGNTVPSAAAAEINVKDSASGKVITASGLGLYTAKVNNDTSFVIDTMGHKSSEFDVIITGPADAVPPYEAIPLRCYQQKDGRLLVEFRTSTPGGHKVDVFENGQHIHNSPFKCQSYNPEEVFISNIPRQSVHAPGSPIQFNVDRTRAGIAELDVTVISPVGDALPIDIKSLNGENGVELVEFMPDVAGLYKFVILYGGQQIPESPISFPVKDSDRRSVGGDGVEGTGTSNLHLRAFGQGLQKGQVGLPCTFEVEQSNGEPLPEVIVLHPNSTIVDAKVEETTGSRGGAVAVGGASTSSVRVVYVPDCTGIFLVHLRQHNGETLEYPVTICSPKSIKITRGFDLSTGCFSPKLAKGEDTVVGLYIGDAGPGKVEAELRPPSGGKVKTDVVSNQDKAEIRFRPYEDGDYLLHIRYNGFVLDFCPMAGFLDGGKKSPAASTTGKVRLTGMGLVRAVCNDENYFLIDGSKSGFSSSVALSPPTVSFAGLVDNEPMPVHLRSVAKYVFEASYSPKEAGTYLLNVTWGGRLVKGCPLKIQAEDNGNDNSAASKVFCSGEGLRIGTLGKDIRTFIDTRKAGPGELSLHCVGPRGKTAYCELNDHQDGTFTLNLKPQEAGRHQLSVKYGGQHVKNSPFTVRVSGAPDPEKVKVYGPGVEHGVLAMYQSRFICDTRGAGAGQLTVRIRGPKGAFRVEMQRESQKDRTILCKYEPTEPGDYRIEVKWSGEHVPGSPFMVMIFDTQEELSRFLQGGYSPQGAGNELYGSIGGPYSSHYGISNIMSWGGSQAHIP